jgi:hypothetical protein
MLVTIMTISYVIDVGLFFKKLFLYFYIKGQILTFKSSLQIVGTALVLDTRRHSMDVRRMATQDMCFLF